jgi:ABC-type phosphate transport system auxiliary subunit
MNALVYIGIAIGVLAVLAVIYAIYWWTAQSPDERMRQEAAGRQSGVSDLRAQEPHQRQDPRDAGVRRGNY